MRYVSEDGEMFDTEAECIKHELRVETEKAKREEEERFRKGVLENLAERYRSIATEFSIWAEDASSYADAYGYFDLEKMCSEIEDDTDILDAIMFLTRLGF